MPATRQGSFRRNLLALAGLAAATLALSACGSSSGGSPSANAADNALKFSRCMREHGIKNFPDPEAVGGGERLTFKAGPGGPSPQTMEAAQKACRRFADANRKKLSPQERVQREEQVNRFARCMREHGIDIHTSTAGGGVQIQIHPGAGGGPNPESPSFQRAQKACQTYLPFKGGPGGPDGPGGKQGEGPSTSKGSGSGASLSLGG
jgi:hypothetical protein